MARLRRQALADHEQRYGPDDPDSPAFRRDLAVAVLHAGSEAEGISLLQQALAEFERSRGRDDPITRESMIELAAAYFAAGRWKEAVSLLVKVEGGSIGGDDVHQIQADAADRQLVSMALSLRPTDEDLLAFEEIATVIERSRGPTHPDSMKVRSAQIHALVMAGRSEEYFELLEQSVVEHERLLGPDSPETWQARSKLAGMYWSSKPDACLALLEQNTSDAARVLGADHPTTLETRVALAGAYKHHDRLPEATALLERTLADRERTTGYLSWDTEMARQKVAAIYQDAGRTEDLIALYTRPVVETDRKLGPDHPTSIAARRNMVTAYRMSGRKDETLLILEQIVADYARVLGPDDPHTLASRSELGRGYILAERRGQAVDLFEELAVDLERLRGPDHPETGMALNRLFQAYNLAGRTEDAAKVLVLSAPVRGVDPLTGVAGRVGMEEAIQSALDELTFDSLGAHSEVTDDVVPGISLLIFDLDDLRIQNDRQGHAFGDEILVTVARRLTAIVRPVDSVARIGGDEFVVLVESVEDPADVAALADRILAAIRQPITVADQRVWMTCTIGSAAGGPGMTARQLLGHADKAMFAGKDQGGNCHVASADE